VDPGIGPEFNGLRAIIWPAATQVKRLFPNLEVL